MRHTKLRTGLTLIEVIVAMLLFAVGGLSLAATAAALARQFEITERRSSAAAVARIQAEKAHATDCANVSAGSESLLGVRADWSVVTGLSSAEVDLRVTRTDVRGSYTDRFLSRIACR